MSNRKFLEGRLFRSLVFFLTSFYSDEDDGSLSRPPMRLFSRNKLSFSSDAESSDSQCFESDDSDSIGCDDGHVSSVQQVGRGGFDAENGEDEDEEEGEW